jgi:isoquinoline 1-oxidoreductase beta subunit
MRHGFFRPFSYHRIEAGVDERGGITAWLHRQAGTSRYAFREGPHPGQSEFREGTYPAGLAPAYRLEYALAPSNIPVGPLRAPGLNAYTFAVESFLEELARAHGRDPVELRLELLGTTPRVLPYGDEDVFETARMRRVIEVAARESGWGADAGDGRGRGFGAMSTFGSYAAQVVEASVDEPTGRVTLHRVTCAIDCGLAVNPTGLRAQVEGGIIDGLGAALYGEITIREGRVQQRNYTDYRILSYSETPEIDVHIIPSSAPPTGAGEPPYPPIFAALANAIHHASGARVRSLPATPERVLEALREPA